MSSKHPIDFSLRDMRKARAGDARRADQAQQERAARLASCTCDRCVARCHYKPGWFRPGEVEKTAALLGVSLPELFRTKLAVDYWVAPKPILVLSPVVVGNQPGDMFPSHPLGKCVFLTDDDRCSIHAAKPHECSASLACDPDDKDIHGDTASAWREYQAQPHALLRGNGKEADTR